MNYKVNQEEPFKVLGDKCAIDGTENGFTLCYGVSKDGPFTAYASATTANEVCVVNGLVEGMWLKLSGNTQDNVTILQ